MPPELDPEPVAPEPELEPEFIPEEPTDEETLPRDPDADQFVSKDDYATIQSERDTVRERLAQVEAENATLRKPLPSVTPATEPEFKFYTPTELTSAVDRGIITEDQRQERIELQSEKRTEKIVRETIRRERAVHEDTVGVEGYLSIMPDLNNQTSDNYQRFAEEWSFHTSRGLPNNETTKLIALRSAFGSLERLKKTKSLSQHSPRLAHGEIGSRGEPATKNGGDPLLKLPKEEKQYYAEQVRSGYMTWDTVREELKFAQTQTVNPALRERSLR